MAAAASHLSGLAAAEPDDVVRSRDRSRPLAAESSRRGQPGAAAALSDTVQPPHPLVQGVRGEPAVRPPRLARLPSGLAWRARQRSLAKARRASRSAVVIAEQTATAPAPRTAARTRRVAGSLALAILAAVGAWQLLTALQTSPYEWHDFAQDYIAAEDVLAGRNPFRPQNERVGQLFNMPTPSEGPAYSFHPPMTIPFFLTLAPLPYPAAFVAWDLIQLLCLWAIVDLTARALGRRLSAPFGAGIALALVAVWPIRESF